MNPFFLYDRYMKSSMMRENCRNDKQRRKINHIEVYLIRPFGHFTLKKLFSSRHPRARSSFFRYWISNLEMSDVPRHRKRSQTSSASTRKFFNFKSNIANSPNANGIRETRDPRTCPAPATSGSESFVCTVFHHFFTLYIHARSFLIRKKRKSRKFPRVAAWNAKSSRASRRRVIFVRSRWPSSDIDKSFVHMSPTHILRSCATLSVSWNT